MNYKGIDLQPPHQPVQFTHSIALDLISGQSGDRNTDWVDTLGGLPWGLLKTEHHNAFVQASTLFSLLNMNYQICNGGIAQYFYNQYHTEREPFHEHDVARYDLDVQKEAFLKLVEFAQELYPGRTAENHGLQRAAEAFQVLWLEENAEVFETVYCDEDEFLEDPETGEEIENPDYFEPYEDTTYEDIIHGEVGFDDIYYEANGYLEELLELQAQYLCKSLARDTERDIIHHPDLAKALKQHLPRYTVECPQNASETFFCIRDHNYPPEHSDCFVSFQGALKTFSEKQAALQFASKLNGAARSKSGKDTDFSVQPKIKHPLAEVIVSAQDRAGTPDDSGGKASMRSR